MIWRVRVLVSFWDHEYRYTEERSGEYPGSRLDAEQMAIQEHAPAGVELESVTSEAIR